VREIVCISPDGSLEVWTYPGEYGGWEYFDGKVIVTNTDAPGDGGREVLGEL